MHDQYLYGPDAVTINIDHYQGSLKSVFVEEIHESAKHPQLTALGIKEVQPEHDTRMLPHVYC